MLILCVLNSQIVFSLFDQKIHVTKANIYFHSCEKLLSLQNLITLEAD